MRAPVLVVCAHGTDDPDGRATTLAIAAAARYRLPGVTVRDAYVDVQRPTLDEVVDALVAAGERVVIVPVLLTLGYHLEVDVAAAVARHPGRVATSGPLGPHEALVDVLMDRLHDTGVHYRTPVVLGVAGSSRPDAAGVAHAVCEALGERWPGPVTVGFLAAASPSVEDAVADARAVSARGRVAVASYLVGRGYFQRRLEGSGGDVTTAPLGDHPRLVDVVVERYLAACRELWQQAVPLATPVRALAPAVPAAPEDRRDRRAQLSP